MRKYLLTFILFGSAFAGCYNLKAQTHTISVVSGPTVRVPGISTPTVVKLNGADPNLVRWKIGGQHLSSGSNLSIVNPGIYTAWVIQINTVPGEGEVEFYPANPSASIDIKGLVHSMALSGTNPLNRSSPTTLCVTSNAYSQYTSSVKWYRGFFEDGNLQACRAVTIPGAYTASVVYSFGAESATVSVNSILIDADPLSPQLRFPIGSYNPVTPADLVVTNGNFFSGYKIFFENNLVANQTSTTFKTIGSGLYRVEGILSAGGIASSSDVWVGQSDIPQPLISASNEGILKYENPTVRLTTQIGYNSGYTWYKNGQVVEGATANALTLSTVGDVGTYTVKGCATYPGGFSMCSTSLPIQITGEILQVNFLRKKVALTENIIDPANMDALPFAQINISTVYADGFARDIQTVQRAASPLAKDIVIEKRYDQFGRELKQILPFTQQKSDGSYSYISRSLQPVQDFYRKDNDKIANTDFPFGETQFEASPFNRVLRQGFAGEDWQLNTTHVKSLAYFSNKITDNIWVWTSTAQGLSASSFYPDGSLSVTEVTDENGHIAREYKDKLGQVILSEKVIENDVLKTYFVFDDLGRIISVVPPMTIATLAVAPNASIANDVLARECYSYSYDERGRQIVKNIPGAGATFIVYDKWNRIVLTQTANQRLRNKWSFNKYEVHDRQILSGEITLAGDNIAATQAVNTFYANVFNKPTLRYEETGGTIHGYTNRSFPVLTNECQSYTVSYYDNYNFLTQFGNAYQFSPDPTLGLTSSSTNVQGLMTGSKTIILGTCNYLKAANYFDNKHRLIQGLADNHLGGIDKSSYKADFTGRITNTKAVHNGLQVVTIQERHTYDPQGRKLQVFEKVNNGSEVLRCDYRYNELGQMVEKNIHSTDGGNTFLQSEDISYNIRGWMEGINPDINPAETEQNVTYQDQFGFKLSYTTAPAGITDFQPTFNGNIAAYSEVRPATIDLNNASFKSVSSYRYDYRDQLIGAKYYQPSDPLKDGFFDMPVITYDPNGNIIHLRRKSAGSVIDDLNYTYNGNQLRKVSDSADPLKGFIDK